MKSLYYVLNKKQFGSSKSGELKQFYVVTVISCDDKKLTGTKSYDKWIDHDTYNQLEINCVYQIDFDVEGKLENIYPDILGTVKVKLDTDIELPND